MPEPAESEVPFRTVLADELNQIKTARVGRGQEPANPPAGTPPAGQSPPLPDNLNELDERDAQRAALRQDLVGLALSGGGIRSATFGLGVLQGLAQFGLLKKIDYLSTVSGGGYIGSWLAAWIKREGNAPAGGVANVEQQLHLSRVDQSQAMRQPPGGPPLAPGTTRDEEPEPIYHLRAYSNYFSPKLGLFSADTWVLAAIYLRNLLLNWMVLLPATMSVLLFTRLVVLFYDWSGSEFWDPVLGGFMIVSFLWALGAIAYWTWRARRPEPAADAARAPSLRRSMFWFHAVLLVPLFLAAVLASWLLSWDIHRQPDPRTWPWFAHLFPLIGWLPWDAEWMLAVGPQGSTLSGVLMLGAFFANLNGLKALVLVLGSGLASWQRGAPASAVARGQPSAFARLARACWMVFCGIASGFVGGALLYLAFGPLLTGVYFTAWDVPFIATIGAPLALLVFRVAVLVEVGLLGKCLREELREWWASLAGWLLIYSAVWASVFAVSLFGAWLLLWLQENASAWIQLALGSTWVAAAVGGALAGRDPATGHGKNGKAKEVLALVAPHIFIVGLLVVVSLLISLLVDRGPPGALSNPLASHLPSSITSESYWDILVHSIWWQLLLWSGVLMSLAVIMAWRVGVNLFSLRSMYANRLVRCYLGASRPKLPRERDLTVGGAPTGSDRTPRMPNPVTGFDPNDDLPLDCLQIGTPNGACDQSPYFGPYVIINTALNLVQGDELAWQERKAESFVLTPCYCGSKSTGYRPTEHYAGGLTLGNAVAISGAAANPNMGYHSSPAVTALMTVFNVRMGAWLGNPRYSKWRNDGPGIGLLYIWKELFGRTTSRSKYIHLSDGGHFDNLGIYELVRRRCRFILASDAGADPNFEFVDLAGVIRKCRTDFGVRIEIDIGALHRQAASGLCRWHCAVGRIRYDDVDPQAVPGILLYIKPSLTGDESSDVQNYAAGSPTFPHETTSDQFFSESQFESYRALGCHALRAVLRDPLRSMEQENERAGRKQAAEDDLKALFAHVHRRWFPPPPEADAEYLESVGGCIDLHVALRTDENLRWLSWELYPELMQEGAQAPAPPTATERIARDRAELHFFAQLLQIMENAYLRMHLDGYHAHPVNSGWMNALRRWTGATRFRLHWRTLRGEYGKEFIDFCERELRLDAGLPRPIAIAADNGSVRTACAALAAEFLSEWPEQGKYRDIMDLSDPRWQNRDGAMLGWLLTLTPDDAPEHGWSDALYPCGCILLWKGDDGTWEVLVWLRGAYRNLGIGRECVRLLRDWPALPRPSRLITRYPDASHQDLGSQMERAMWLTFFSYYGFVREPNEDPKAMVMGLAVESR